MRERPNVLLLLQCIRSKTFYWFDSKQGGIGVNKRLNQFMKTRPGFFLLKVGISISGSTALASLPANFSDSLIYCRAYGITA